MRNFIQSNPIDTHLARLYPASSDLEAYLDHIS